MPSYHSALKRLGEVVSTLHSIIKEYHRVVMERLAKISHSETNAHGGNKCLEESSEGLQAQLDRSFDEALLGCNLFEIDTLGRCDQEKGRSEIWTIDLVSPIQAR